MASILLRRHTTDPNMKTKRRSTNNCEVCQVRPKFTEGGKTYSYCGKNCAAKAENDASASSGNCNFCLRKPKFADGDRVHDFCSKTCADAWKARQPKKRQDSSMSTVSQKSNGCRIPGCTNPLESSKSSHYCSPEHKKLAETACLLCGTAAKQTYSHFCSKSCNDGAARMGPVLLEVPKNHDTFVDVEHQFKRSWRHGTSVPKVRRVYKIIGSASSVAKYDAYREAVEARGRFAAQNRSPRMTAGNENRRWHGTRRECNLGDPGIAKFCGSATCPLCNIVKTSFNLDLFGARPGKKSGWGRFGRGIYTSSTSSKANDYSLNVGSSPLKAVLLNKVVVGKGYKALKNNETLTAPPSGYDSVLGEVGDVLNYDEVVVYTNDAVRPSYLIMYDA